MYYSVFQKSDDILIFKNNSVKNEPALVSFGTWNPKETSHQKISPVKCCHCTLWKSK